MAYASGAVGGSYSAEISQLQAYQKEVLQTLDEMIAGSAALTAGNAVLGAFTGQGANNGLGTFPEAVELSNAYNGIMQAMLTNFKEISALVTTMANVLGTSAQNYADTEQQLTDQFKSIVAKYETQAGGFTIPGTATSTAAPTTSGQSGTSDSYFSATTANGAADTTETDPSSSSSSSSSSDPNDANTPSSTSGEM
jgi:hypothetical protein